MAKMVSKDFGIGQCPEASTCNIMATASVVRVNSCALIWPELMDYQTAMDYYIVKT
jgi:hypothetical protein